MTVSAPEWGAGTGSNRQLSVLPWESGTTESSVSVLAPYSRSILAFASLATLIGSVISLSRSTSKPRLASACICWRQDDCSKYTNPETACSAATATQLDWYICFDISPYTGCFHAGSNPAVGVSIDHQTTLNTADIYVQNKENQTAA